MCILEVSEGVLGLERVNGDRPVRRESIALVHALYGSARAFRGGARFQRHFGNRGDRICLQVTVETWGRSS